MSITFNMETIESTVKSAGGLSKEDFATVQIDLQRLLSPTILASAHLVGYVNQPRGDRGSLRTMSLLTIFTC
jgi:hypothetical protein